MNYILFDGPFRNRLLPFTYTRPVAELRIGILSLREKWEKVLNRSTTTVTEDYLATSWPLVESAQDTLINACFFPTKPLVTQIKKLKKNQVLCYKNTFVAFLSEEDQEVILEDFERIPLEKAPFFIENTWDIFSKNADAIAFDFKLLTNGKTSEKIPDSVYCVAPENIFIEEGAKLHNGSLNASKGPIYIGKEAEVMENSSIRGPFALCAHSIVKMGTKIYGGTTVGPYSKVGGELNNSVIFGHSNKGHDGYLGNSVLGEWCNLGADTNNSNLKNNYAEVRLWSYETERFSPTGQQFCGLMMGDHSKCGINTMFNTGTVVGVSANIFGSGFPRNFIPSFSWGGSQGTTTYKTEKAFAVAQEVMRHREIPFTAVDHAILTHVFEESQKFRRG